MRKHKGQQLDECPNNTARVRLCRAWAEEARNSWYSGQRRAIERAQRNPQYAHLDPDKRTVMGRVDWGNDKQSSDLAGEEQMYWRWMNGYVGMIQIGILE